MPVVETRNIRFSYEDGPEVLTDVSLAVDEGEFVALLGANGAGKTTFAKMLNGILQPDSGTIHIQGEDIIGKKTAELAAWVGYCYQNPDHQIFADSVSKELEFGPSNLGVPKDEVKRRVLEVLDLVGLSEHADEYPFLLSKGIRQQIAVASILTMRPKVMLIDEPTTGMDLRGSQSIMHLIRKLNEVGHTILIITHDLKIVAEYAHRAVVFKDGGVVFDGQPTDLFTQAALLESVLGVATPVYRLVRACDTFWDVPEMATVDQFADWVNRSYKRGD